MCRSKTMESFILPDFFIFNSIFQQYISILIFCSLGPTQYIYTARPKSQFSTAMLWRSTLKARHRRPHIIIHNHSQSSSLSIALCWIFRRAVQLLVKNLLQIRDRSVLSLHSRSLSLLAPYFLSLQPERSKICE